MASKYDLIEESEIDFLFGNDSFPRLGVVIQKTGTYEGRIVKVGRDVTDLKRSDLIYIHNLPAEPRELEFGDVVCVYRSSIETVNGKLIIKPIELEIVSLG